MELKCRYEGETPVIVFFSPDGANRFDTASLLKLRRQLQQAEGEGRDCVILTGEGETFCLGGDLGELAEMTRREMEAFGRALTGTLLHIVHCGVTVLAAVNGHAAGGGLSLVEACDLAVGANTATFSIPEVRGGSPPVVSYASAYHVLGRKAANELALLAKPLSAAEALESGLLNRVAEKGRVLDECRKLAEEVRQAGSFSRREIKALSRRMDGGLLTARLEAAADRLSGVMLAGKREE